MLFLPDDFDPRFFLCASPGLTTGKHLCGGEPVKLVNLSRGGSLYFQFPRLSFVIDTLINRQRVRSDVVIDRVIIEPDQPALGHGLALLPALWVPCVAHREIDRRPQIETFLMIECQIQVPTHPVMILNAGLNTSVGASLPPVSPAYRGRLSTIEEYDWLPSGVDGRPLVAAAHTLISPGLDPIGRMLWLADLAAREALAILPELGLDPAGFRIPALLALPSPRPGWTQDHPAAFIRAWAKDLPCGLDPDHSSITDTGHHGAIALLGQAVAMLEAGDQELCLVGDVDSWIDIDLLDWLDQQGRPKSPTAPRA